MIAVDMQNINKSYGGHMVLEDLSLVVKAKTRVGLIGNNGTGKTTLFKLISGQEWPDEGRVLTQKKAQIGYLDQIPVHPDKTASQVLHEAFANLERIKLKLKAYEDKMQDPQMMADQKILDEYGNVLSEYELAGGYEVAEKLSKICQGFRLDDDFLQKDFDLLSGGEKTRLMLAKLLLESPTILLLDEPTNHLDLDMVQWLEDYLKSYEHTVIIISHDRYFLDAVVTEIFEVRNKQVDHYAGNYSYYVHERNERLKSQENQYKQQQRKIKAMNESIKRFRDWGARVENEKMFKKAKELEKRLEKMDKIDKPQFDDKKMNLTFEKDKNRSKEVIRVEDLSFAYDNQVLFKETQANMYKGDRVVLMGPNGSGKSTLLHLLLKKLDPLEGQVKVGETIKVGYMPQEISFERPEETVLELFKDTFIYTELVSRRKLAQFLFTGDDVYKKVGQLSGGEKVRLSLCMMVEQAVDFLILDEPTNHVDINSREMLEEALQAFKGSLLFISHDRYFINKLASKVWSINQYKIDQYDGDYKAYKDFLSQLEIVEEVKLPKKKVKKIVAYKDKVIDFEALIKDLEDEISETKVLMADLNEDYEALMAMQAELEIQETKLNELYEKWLET